MANRAWRAGVALVAGLGLAAGTFTVSQAAQESVTLRLKAQPGQHTQRHYQFKMGLTQEAPGAPSRQQSQEVELWVGSEVLSLAGRGRMRLRQRLDRLKFAKGRGGAPYQVFDSANPAHVEAARRDPGFAYLFASLDAQWTVVLEPNGEVWDQEFTVPGSGRDNTVKMIVSSFLQPLIDMGIYSFPKRPIKPGDTWECGTVDVQAPGGRLEGTAECVFQQLRDDDKERTAIILVKRSATYRATPGSATRARMTRFDEGGMIAFAVDRGVIKLIHLKGASSFSLDLRGGQATMDIINELLVREVAR